jgi:tight adherence protein B
MAEMAQDRLDFQRTMRAKTGAGRSSTILIATISPLVYLAVFIWQPNHVKTLYTDPVGQMLLALAIVLEIVGVLWVMALLRQEN